MGLAFPVEHAPIDGNAHRLVRMLANHHAYGKPLMERVRRDHTRHLARHGIDITKKVLNGADGRMCDMPTEMRSFGATKLMTERLKRDLANASFSPWPFY